MTRNEFRRRPRSDVWHFVPWCRWWPLGEHEWQTEQPTTGELCDECLAKERNQ